MKNIVIIGGGLGGLAAGMALGKKGHKVTLFEQFARVGGYATTWRRDGVAIEGVLHEIDDMGAASEKVKILTELGMSGVEFVKIPQFYRVVASGVDFVLPSGKENIIGKLIENFADEKAGIEKFFGVLQNITDEIKQLMRPTWTTYLKMMLFPLFFPNMVKYEKKNTKDFFDECFKNDAIKVILGANLGYYTDDSAKLSMLIFATAQNSYYTGHGWFVKGGSQNLSDSMANAIRNNGGEVIVKANVTKILTKNGKAIGVEYDRKNEQKTIFCDEIMNNASPIWALGAMDDKKIAEKQMDQWTNKADISPSSFAIYAVVKGQKPSDDRAYSTFVFEECGSLEDMKNSVYSPFEKRAFTVTDYGVIDSGLGCEDRRLVSIFTTDSYDEWSDLGIEEYEAKKEAAAKILIERASKIYPDISENLISYEAATPLTNERYTKNPKGAIYGYSQTVQQAGRHRAKFAKILPNVTNASAWGSIGGGYTGAIYGGLVAAGNVK